MRRFVLAVIMLIIVFVFGNGQTFSGRPIHMMINGNDYPFLDLLNDSIKSNYNYYANTGFYKQVVKEIIRSNIPPAVPPGGDGACGPDSICIWNWPTDISSITYSQIAPNIIKLSAQLDNISIQWNNYRNDGCGSQTCRITLGGSIIIGATLELIKNEFSYFFKISAPNVEDHLCFSLHTAWADDPDGELICRCRDIGAQIASWFGELSLVLKVPYEEFMIPLANLTSIKLPTGVPITDEIANEVTDALPLTLNFGVHADGNLAIIVDILPQYAGSNPSPVANPSYDYIGYGCPYYAFQTAFGGWKNMPPMNDTTKAKLLIDAMDGFKTQSIRFSIPFKDLSSIVNPDTVVNPDNLVNQGLETAIGKIPVR